MHRAELILNPGATDERRFSFVESVVIGRRLGGTSSRLVRVVLDHDLISGRHCVVRQERDGRFFVRDESRNGTRIAGRRLVPRILTELRPGQRIELPEGSVLELGVGPRLEMPTHTGTVTVTRSSDRTYTEATILVGDIAGYTTMNQRLPARRVLDSVQRVFQTATRVVQAHAGTVWEYEGDALFAFWERDPERPHWHIRSACQAALDLDGVTRTLAGDEAIWSISEFPLRMDWALATGMVIVGTLGADRPTGLAVYGSPVGKATRLEKLADTETGSILADATTYKHARPGYAFRDLGPLPLEGSGVETVYALVGSSPPRA